MDVANEVVEVGRNQDNNIGNKNENGACTDGPDDFLSESRQVMSEKQNQKNGKAQKQNDRLCHLKQLNFNGHQVGPGIGALIHIQVEFSPQGEIERSHKHSQGSGDGGQTDRQGRVAFGQVAHEVGDVASGTGSDQDHAQGYGGRWFYHQNQ